jgi:hypothetical protein
MIISCMIISVVCPLPGGAACRIRDRSATSRRDVDQADWEPSRQDIKAALAAMRRKCLSAGRAAA